MEVQNATVDQIAIFKKAAAARYMERGIDPKTASQLFDMQMAKVGAELGLDRDVQKIDKVASAIATKFGIKRAQASPEQTINAASKSLAPKGKGSAGTNPLAPPPALFNQLPSTQLKSLAPKGKGPLGK